MARIDYATTIGLLAMGVFIAVLIGTPIIWRMRVIERRRHRRSRYQRKRPWWARP